jgi:hypothetical protein
LRLGEGDCAGAAAALAEMANRLPGDRALIRLRESLSAACPASEAQ